MKLTKGTQYAVKALQFISEVGHRTTLENISKATGMNHHYLEQIFRKLRLANLVDVKRGRGGGYFPYKTLDNLSVYEVAFALGEFETKALDLTPTITDKIKTALHEIKLNEVGNCVSVSN
jgi:Rrf2 family protein